MSALDDPSDTALRFKGFDDLLELCLYDPDAEFEVRRRYETVTAVLVCDYSSMVKRSDSDGILYALALARAAERAFEPAVAGRGGQVIKRVADTFFAVFQTPQQALAAALDGQRLMVAFNQNRTGTLGDGTRSDPIHACLGLGWGSTLVIPGEDIYGPEVNRAFVLGEDVARPGEILVSEAFLEGLGELPEGIGAHLGPADRRAEAGFEFHVLRDFLGEDG